MMRILPLPPLPPLAQHDEQISYDQRSSQREVYHAAELAWFEDVRVSADAALAQALHCPRHPDVPLSVGVRLYDSRVGIYGLTGVHCASCERTVWSTQSIQICGPWSQSVHEYVTRCGHSLLQSQVIEALVLFARHCGDWWTTFDHVVAAMSDYDAGIALPAGFTRFETTALGDLGRTILASAGVTT